MTIPRPPDESGNLEFELIRTARYQLRALAGSLLRLGVQLDTNQIPADRWGPVVRTLQLLDSLSSRNLVAVAGEQGAGKTHLLTNLYPAAAGWLAGNIGRGEKNAVAVQERPDLTEARGIAVRRRRWDPHGRKTDSYPGEGLTYEVTYTFDEREQWCAALTGDDSDVVLVVLEVPLSFLGVPGAGFVLLPGFERVRDTEWQLLMKLVLATSPAALVVVDGGGMAGGTHAEILQHLRHAGGQAIEFVVAVNRCEELRSPDLLAQRVSRAMEVYGAREADVIPAGRTRDDPAGWPDRLRTALEPIRATSAQSHRLEAALLRQVIRDEVQGVVNVARTALDTSALRDDNVAAEIDEYMLIFDRAAAKLRNDLRAQVHEAFGRHCQAARHRLETSLEGSGWKYGWQFTWDRVQLNPGDTVARLAAVVEEAWDPDQAQQVQQMVIGDVADGLWRAYGPAFATSLGAAGPGQPALALLGGLPPADTPGHSPDHRTWPPAPVPGALPAAAGPDRAGIASALRVLPGAALQARGIALRLAGPDGQIPDAPDEHRLNEILRNVAGIERQLLTTLSVVAGGAEPAKGTGGQAKESSGQAKGSGGQAKGPSEILDSINEIAGNTRELSSGLKKLLSKKTPSVIAAVGQAGAAAATAAPAAAAAPSATAVAAGAATTAAAVNAAVATAGPAVASGAVAGEATAATAAATGATLGAALTAALTAVGVAAVGAIVLQAGNRVVRERDRLSRAWLTEWRTATEASILMNAEDLIRVTRDIVEQRLRFALGADEDVDRRFRMRQAIEDTRRDRALMLEVLGDDHLG
jgi:hypothetical protein